MRRLVFSILAVCCAASFSACAGGGDVLSTTKNPAPTSVIVTAGGPENIARVLPGQSIAVSAVQTYGTTNGALTGNRYTWTAALTTGGQYASNSSGTTKSCASVMKTTGAVTAPYTADFSIYVAIDPTNEANVLFIPPPVIPPLGGSTFTTNYPYCVTITATAVVPGTPAPAAGSLTIAVVDPLNPLQ